MVSSTAHAVPECGLLIYRASRLEALIEPLRALLEASPPSGLLAPAELICAHPGMRRWLLNELARRSGARGIAANLQIDLPGEWVERVSRAHGVALDRPAPGASLLHWRLFDLLGEAEPEPTSANYAEYLKRDESGRRRWQLAATLADILGRLLVYRPDWLRAWQRGQSVSEHDADLAALWRRLRQRWPEALRIDQQAQIAQSLAGATVEPIPLHVFGIAHLPPATLDLLRAAARQRPVVLYFPDPCRELWVGLRDDRQRLRQLLEAGADDQAELLYLGTEHPLLASLGRLGQHFSALLAGADSDTVLDIRHWEDEVAVRSQSSLLEQVQQSVRELDVHQIAKPANLDVQAAADSLALDASLRIHRCHSRLRELEVLRDALLQALNDDPALQPGDITVLSPSMQAYAPLLPAVFGAPADPRSRLPYHVADLPQSADHPLFASFVALLSTPAQRVTCSEILTLLDLSMLRCALNMQDVSRQQVEHWLQSAGIAWGLDARSREQQALPSTATHSFAWGIDRLIAGHLLGEDAAHAGLVDAVLPVDALSISEAPAFGGLCRLLSELHTLRAMAAVPMPASRWSAHALHLATTLFLPAPQQDDERRAHGQLLACLGRLEQQRSAAGIDPQLNHPQALAWIRDALSDVPEHSPFLHGGISFCGMVPQRALPFKVIAVLGLNEADYPRRETAEQHDPMRHAPRPGDRSVLIDDRYLFLETLMSARWRLHLSFIGEHPATGKALNPSAPLFELDRLLQQQLPLGAEHNTPLRPWSIEHPLQPFDARYFSETGHPALFTYRDAMHPRSSGSKPSSPAHAENAEDASVDTAPIAAKHLLRWLRDPAAELLRDRHRIRLDGVDIDQLPEHEPLDQPAGSRQPLWRDLLMRMIETGELSDAQPSALLLASGRLPAAELGQRIYAAERDKAVILCQHTREHTPMVANPAGRWVSVPLQLDNRHALNGQIEPVWSDGDSLWLAEWQLDSKKASRWALQLPLLCRWLMLSLQPLAAANPLKVAVICDKGQHDFAAHLNDLASQADFHSRAARAARGKALDLLIQLYRHADRQPLGYFPTLSAAALKDKGQQSAWLGGPRHTGERDYQPGFARLLAGEAHFWLSDHPAAAQLVNTAQQLSALLECRFDATAEAGS